MATIGDFCDLCNEPILEYHSSDDKDCVSCGKHVFCNYHDFGDDLSDETCPVCNFETVSYKERIEVVEKLAGLKLAEVEAWTIAKFADRSSFERWLGSSSITEKNLHSETFGGKSEDAAAEPPAKKAKRDSDEKKEEPKDISTCMLEMLRDSKEDAGVARADIYIVLSAYHFSEAEVRGALDKLNSDGLVYETIDEDHFKAS